MSDALAIAIVSGLFVAIPATITAYAGLLKARKADAQLKPSNGHTVAHMVEEMWARQAMQLEDHECLKGICEVVDDLNRDLRSHMEDAASHYREQHDFCQHRDGNAVCPICLSPRP